jgi:TRAP-type C4-dicarboxylate transport system substrate-binding protein
MNLKKWDSLPQDVQKVFEEVSLEWIMKTGSAWDASDEEGRKYTLSLGNKLVRLDVKEAARWAKAIEPVIDNYVKDLDKKKLPGQKYVETIRELMTKHSGK